MMRATDLFRFGFLIAVLAAFLGGCALETPPPSTGYLPADAFAGRVIGDQDTAFIATNEAAYAFGHPGAMQGRASEMALAVASLDAIAGQFTTDGRWLDMNPLAKIDMLDARRAVRRVLGIAPGTASQTVIDSMITISQALRHRDRKAALAAARGPEFTYPPERTLEILGHFPPVPVANQATSFARRYLLPGGGMGQLIR